VLDNVRVAKSAQSVVFHFPQPRLASRPLAQDPVESVFGSRQDSVQVEPLSLALRIHLHELTNLRPTWIDRLRHLIRLTRRYLDAHTS